MESIWKRSVESENFIQLQNEIKTDVLIVGGGLAGILCAYMLKNAGIECVLVEADHICGGVTGYTTAKITLQHGIIYDKIIKKYGLESAKLYLSAHRDALSFYDKLCHNIDCDYKTEDAFVYSA